MNEQPLTLDHLFSTLSAMSDIDVERDDETLRVEAPTYELFFFDIDGIRWTKCEDGRLSDGSITNIADLSTIL